ncbi:hypothetical protein [Emticicia fluvialis]|uniref:hypothetical protein n=1 Tax=Emticicia fluvialis TaxID=2974474 RepID=UPI002166555A|nr:hypothetical protein [Emticicia fluvialis]
MREPEIQKTIIPVDLNDKALKIISYAFIISKDILCNHTIFHCLEDDTTKEEAGELLKEMLVTVLERIPQLPQTTIKIHVVKGNFIEELTRLEEQEKFNTLAIGTGNKAEDWEMGETTRKIVMSIPVRIIAVPPQAEMVFPGSLGVLVETIEESYSGVFDIFMQFVAYYNLFLSFVVFAKDKQKLEEERALIEGFKDFFSDTITFSFILEEEQTVLNFLKYADELGCDGTVIAWDEGTTAYKLARDTGRVFCNPLKPILYLNRSELKGIPEHLFFADEIAE